MESFALPQAQARWPGQQVLREGCAGVSCFAPCYFMIFLVTKAYLVIGPY
jgi:hypothetical protein